MSLDQLRTPEPHYVPGYTGYCPQYLYRCGETYGSLTHKILLDPRTHKSHQLVLSNRNISDFQVLRSNEETNILEARNYSENSVYKHPITPGYMGSIPKSQSVIGKTFSVAAEDGLLQFEKEAERKKQSSNSVFPEEGGASQTSEEKKDNKARYKLPLIEARPEYINILKNQMKTETTGPFENVPSPYFKNLADPEKKLKSGYSGHVPFGHSKYGQGYAPLTNSALCDFTTSYQTKKSTEWAPIGIIQPEPPHVVSSNEIYHKHMGMVPNYTGHVPGLVFKSGRTYGNVSKDAKRWLQGDFSE